MLAPLPMVVKSLAEGREWKYSARSNFCASRALPTSCCLASVSWLPLACQGKNSWASPVTARG
ncbi:hypothetical protein D3C87_2021780 [compost metagenome]